MLVLSVKPGERVFIGDSWMKVLKVSGQKVTLGIDADGEVPVDRESVRAKKEKEAILAAAIDQK